jgi:RNA polymerase sigma-70 factor, ECF subfamily
MTSDAHLMEEPASGTEASEPDWDALYMEQLSRVYNYCRYRLGSETLADDLTARTFEKAWLARHRYRRNLSGFGTWLLRIARNVCVDHLRTAHEHAPLEEAADAPAGSTPEDEAVLSSNFARLTALFAELPEREREVLALKYGAGATNRAIAEITGLSESNVGTILHRSVQSLRAKW